MALTDSQGSVAERIAYEAFGNGAGSALTRYGFTGRERDAVTGQMYHRARWYDPEQGRFLTEDPIGFASELNLYAYALNNPLSFFDPTGLSFGTFAEGFLEGFAIGGILGYLTAAAMAATGGIPAAIILGISLGLSAAALYAAIDELMHGNLCPDERDRLLGQLLGRVVGRHSGGRRRR